VNAVKRLCLAISFVLVCSFVVQLPVLAETSKDIMDESIYDLLVDRYFNKTIENDFEVNTKDPSKFAGGDFEGLTEKLSHIKKMGFTLVSLGPVFSTDTYDGKKVLDYTKFERHFGTEDEFKNLLEEAHDKELNVVVDFPIQGVSNHHVWTQDSTNTDWIIDRGNGAIDWNLENPDVQQALIGAAVDFVNKYEVDGLRITAIEGVNSTFLNEIIRAVKESKEELYVLSNEESNAAFDLSVVDENEEIYRNLFKNVDIASDDFENTLVDSEVVRTVDTVNDRRFTADAAEENMFPPTRWKMVLAILMSVPGVPVMTYGSEIAMNGEKPPESNQILNFKVEEELINYISDLQLMRNGSAALRSGKMELLHNEDGFIVYKRSNDEESWIVAINNSGKTQQFDLTSEVIGENKELRGLFESNILRQREDGKYRIVLNREVAEFFTVNEYKGFNKAYMAALASVFVLFLGFIYLVWRKGKQRQQKS
jgi:cyclomaltodextrinase